MNIRYASLLAATKFRTRLGRSIVTVVAASLVASIMLVASFSLTGLEKGVREMGDTKLASMHLVKEGVFGSTVNPDGTQDTSMLPFRNLEEYKLYTKDDGIVEAFQEYPLDPIVFTEPKVAMQSMDGDGFRGGDGTFSITARSAKLYSLYLGDNPPAIAAGSVPAVVSLDVLTSLADLKFGTKESAAARVEKLREAASTWLGKQVTVSQTPSPEQPAVITKLTIQGFFSTSGLLNTGEYGSVIVPDDAVGTLTSNPITKVAGISYFGSFQNEDTQLKYIEDVNKPNFDGKFYRFASAFGSPLLALRELQQTTQKVLLYVVLALLVAVGIAMLTTLAKIISDSERESGVFRAIGAKSQDILQIYLTYSVFVSAAAIVVAFTIALAISTYLSSTYAPELTAQLISLSGTAKTDASISLVGFNFLHVVGVCFAVTVAGVLGTLIPLSNLLRQDPIKALRAD